jgi:CBS domain-containing protein
MRDRDIGDVLVTDDDGRLAGIVTDRDIVVRCLAEGAAGDTTLDRACSSEVHTLDVGSSVGDAIDMMRAHAMRRVPVVEGGRAVGIVSIGDLAVEREPDSALGDISAAAPND